MLPSGRQLVESLQDRVRDLERTRRSDFGRVGSGCAALDRILPGRGFQRGTLVEWIGSPGGGAATLALVAAREACREGGLLVVIDGQWRFYPPAAAALGIDWEQTVLVRTRHPRDEHWAWTQSLQSPAVAAVWGWPQSLDDRAFRRLQLAAERGGVLGCLAQPGDVLARPAWSDVRLLVETLPSDQAARRWRVEVVRCRNGQAGKAVELEMHHETGRLHEARSMPVASAVAAAALVQRASGA